MARRARGLAVVAALLLAASSAPAAAQEPPSSTERLAHDLAEAEQLLREHKPEAAETAFRAVIAAARLAAIDADEAQAQCGLGEALIVRADYRGAEAPLAACLEMSERAQNLRGVARATLRLGALAEMVGRKQDATAYADRAIAAYTALQDRGHRAAATLLRVRVHEEPYADKEPRFVAAIDDARAAGDRTVEASAWHDWGDTLFNRSQFEAALEKLTRARDLYHADGDFDNEGTVYNSIGRVYRAHGRIDEALAYQRQALALHEQYGRPYTLMQSHNAVAVVENQLGFLADARQHYERALALAEASGSPRIEDLLRGNIGSLLIDEGRYAEGVAALEAVLARNAAGYSSTRYTQLSLGYLKMRRLTEALAAAQRASQTCGEDRLACLGALNMRAAAEEGLDDREAALADLHAAFEVIEGLRATLVPVDFLKQNFARARLDLYSRAIAIALDQHQDRDALDTAEMASARAFVDLLAARDVAATAAAGDIASPIAAAAARTDDLVAIARRLRSTVVVYWPADDGLFVWVVHGDGAVVARRVDVSERRLVELIAAAGRDVAPGAVVRPWRQLYELLVAPIRVDLPRTPGALLTIIPHGVLHAVSFAALQARSGRYLIEDYTLHYAPAGAVLSFTAQRRVPLSRTGRALLVADPAVGPPAPLEAPLPPLPASRREVADIAALLPRRRVTLLEGRDATETRVRESAAGRTIVHFATHAILRDDDPNASYLALAPPERGDAPGQGLLTARAIYDLRLTADLVVLSACQSAGGRVTGDGIATFARGFLYAGTPSLVASLWDVADQGSSRLLPSFYRGWLAGASKARSLRRAQLQLLADLRAGRVRVETKAGPAVLPERPRFWAGFVLIGEPE